MELRLKGAGFIAISACSFATMAIFAKTAYGSGAETLAVLLLRFGLSSLIMIAIMLVGNHRWPQGRNLLTLIGMGSLGYAGQSFCFFAALNYASAGLVALLLYLHPVMVALAGSTFLGYRLTVKKFLAILTALAGTALTIGGAASGSTLGIVLGISAAIIYSVYILVGSKMLEAETPIAAATVIMLSATAVFAALALMTKPAFPQTITGWVAVGCIALISTVVAMITFFAGLRLMSPGDAATISTLEPLVTVVLAAIYLAEPLTVTKVIGGAIIVGSLIALARSR